MTAPPPSASPPPTDSQPRYEFIKMLGRGGMAEVLLAHKFAPGGGFKEVAFKRILPQFTRDPDRVAKFLDEIAVAAALVHPNIVGVHHWGHYEGDYFIEMELVRGMTMMDFIRARAEVPTDNEDDENYGRLLPVDVALIGAQMAEGLQFAHTFERPNQGGKRLTGVVHRDVSPDNVMLDLHGSAKINDWGISKALRGADRKASKTGTAAGKVYYSPPEQWKGDPLDARADLYALGASLVVALCGRQLFPSGPGETFESILIRVVHGQRPTVASLAPPDAPPDLVQLLERLVQRDREHRPGSAKELVRAFKDIARRLGGDLDTAREGLAARVREHYGGDSSTEKALSPPHFDNVPAESTRRPINPATRQNGPQAHAQSGPRGTAVLGPATPPTAPMSNAVATAAPPSPRSGPHPALWAALGGGLVLVVLLAAVAGFVFAGSFGQEDPAPVAPQPVEPPPTAQPSSDGPEEVPAPEATPEASGQAQGAPEPPSAVPTPPVAPAPAPEPATEPIAAEETPPAVEETGEAARPRRESPRQRRRRRTTAPVPTPEIQPFDPSPVRPVRPTPRRRRASDGDFGL